MWTTFSLWPTNIMSMQQITLCRTSEKPVSCNKAMNSRATRCCSVVEAATCDAERILAMHLQRWLASQSANMVGNVISTSNSSWTHLMIDWDTYVGGVLFWCRT